MFKLSSHALFGVTRNSAICVNAALTIQHVNTEPIVLKLVLLWVFYTYLFIQMYFVFIDIVSLNTFVLLFLDPVSFYICLLSSVCDKCSFFSPDYLSICTVNTSKFMRRYFQK